MTSSRNTKGHAEYDPSLELMRRCRHASASVGGRIYMYGGLREGKDSKVCSESSVNRLVAVNWFHFD